MQYIFERHEKKYLISKEQAEDLQKIFSQYMDADKYGEYLVQNIYFDNDNWDVIRKSTEKPLYKEKMRLRCYDLPNKESKVFFELKKKFDGTVYKRRCAIPFGDLLFRPVIEIAEQQESQIMKELYFYMMKNMVEEKAYISYKRKAFNGSEKSKLRVSFDSDIRFRLDNMNFLNPKLGSLVLPQDKIVLEIKALGAMPLWMAGLLSEYKIFPVAFSKYGTSYTDFIIKEPLMTSNFIIQTKNEEKISA